MSAAASAPCSRCCTGTGGGGWRPAPPARARTAVPGCAVFAHPGLPARGMSARAGRGVRFSNTLRAGGRSPRALRGGAAAVGDAQRSVRRGAGFRL